VRRRRIQTFVIGVVVLFSTAAVTVALALLNAASAPFDRVFQEQDGAHLVALFEPSRVSADQLSGHRPPGVQAVAGPFRQAQLEIPPGGDSALGARSLTVVGRADPGGPVDRVDLWIGRWATAPGEVVLNSTPQEVAAPADVLGMRITVPGRPTLTVVGRAYSVSQTADAWVAPGQITALRPSATQMLYRFTEAASPGGVDAGTAAVTAGLPRDALLATRSWLTVRQAVAAGPERTSRS
jgi:putative ABC transport system permease protein